VLVCEKPVFLLWTNDVGLLKYFYFFDLKFYLLTTMKQFKRTFGFTFIFLLTASSALAQQELSAADSSSQLLNNPRKALHTFLYYQQESSRDLSKASMPLRTGLELSDQQLTDRTEKLKRILDSRGLFIEFDNVPEDPAYTDSLSGRSQYTPFASLPNVYLVKNGDEWRFSQTTVDAVPAIYSETFSVFVDVVVDELPPAMHENWLGLEIWQYFAIFFWLLIGLMLRKVFEFFFENYARKLVGRTETRWDDLLVAESEKPISFLFMIGFFWATYANLMLSVTTNYYLSSVLSISFLASFVWLFYNLINVLTQFLDDLTATTDSKLDDQLVPLIRKTLKVFVIVVGIIFILQNNGINVTSLLAGLGLGGLAIALAAKDTLANFFGSITIFTDQPFQVGDLIKMSNAEGVVEEVGFRSTRLRTLYDSVTSVPNSILANTEIDNLGLRRRRRLNTTLNLTYDTSAKQMEAFVEGVKSIIRAGEHINQTNYEVHFNGYGAHSLDVLVYLFFEVKDWSQQLQLQHNFLLDVMRLAEEVGVEFAYPTQTLHVDSFHGEKPRRSAEERSDEELVSAVYAFGPEGEHIKPDGIVLKKDGKEINLNAQK
jgi:MscS family membrane protein